MQAKKLIQPLAAALCMLLCFNSFAQQFEVPKTIPPFNMILTDGVTYYNASNINKSMPLMIVYFDPECEHCRQYTKNLLKNIKKFSGVQIVMICNAPGVAPVKNFVTTFKLSSYANIKVGTEGLYSATLNFYHVSVTPFTALYNSSGLLIKYYRTVPEIQQLVMQLSR
jgi:hypothetical protein